MKLFGRRKPLHEKLAEAAGIAFMGVPAAPVAQPPGWFGERRGEPGIHGVPRARKWDTVTTTEAPGLRGDSVHFVTLPDGTVVVDEDEPDGSVAPLADAVEETLRPPYRAEGVRHTETTWSVGAVRIAVVADPSLDGEEAELVVAGGERTLTVDGQRRVAVAPGLQRVGEAEGPEYVVRAHRIDGDLWEVEADAL